MKKMIFEGTATAIVTPFSNNKIDYGSYKKHLDLQVAAGVSAIVVCGTTGEAATLTDEEHRDIIEFTVKHIAGKIPVIAGTGSNDTSYSVELSRHAAQVGADALLLVTPYYNKCSQAGLVKHFEAVADVVDIPCILYNVPSRTGLSISIDAYTELSKHPNIAATKEACGDIAYITRVKSACGDDLHIYSGNDNQIVPVMSIGGKGVISVLSNIMPEFVVGMTNAFRAGNIEGAGKLQVQAMDIDNAMFSVVNPIPVKTAMAKMGLCGEEMRLPLYPMSDTEKEKLYTVMKKYKLI